MARNIGILHMHNRQNASFTEHKDPIQMNIYLYFLRIANHIGSVEGIAGFRHFPFFFLKLKNNTSMLQLTYEVDCQDSSQSTTRMIQVSSM